MAKRELTPIELEEANNLAEAWNEYREHHPGATQTWLAEEAGLGTQGAVGQYLRGVIPLNLDALIKLCGVLGVNPRKISQRLSAPLDNVISTLAVTNRVESLLLRNGWEVAKLPQAAKLMKVTTVQPGIEAALVDLAGIGHRPDFLIHRNGEFHLIELSMHAYQAVESFIHEAYPELKGHYHILSTGDVDRLIAEMQHRGLISIEPATAKHASESNPMEDLIPVEFELFLEANGTAIRNPLPPDGPDMFVPRFSETLVGSAGLIRGDGLRPRLKPGEAILVQEVDSPAPGDEVLVTMADGAIRLLEYLRSDDLEVEFSSVNDAGRMTIEKRALSKLEVIVAHFPRRAIQRK